MLSFCAYLGMPKVNITLIRTEQSRVIKLKVQCKIAIIKCCVSTRQHILPSLVFFKKWAIPDPYVSSFRLFKHSIQILKQINVR